eukprot:CAMPEP_0206276114 /NCGR_PEP_ID=MMETSP0047_2-20121206/36124_1 /ASSEMBLY_ACC=CAM_ASM_000192 /TAXON_ID=195065 /ORGANISM="Chroomonas mesostigmatica_cf, Strain CCMP1168" /LENGTH=58 /DNA_ID=CAMNT_0053705591 /DNA_START=74 /DNA_END=246 /DNA_ORIENTATION=-
MREAATHLERMHAECARVARTHTEIRKLVTLELAQKTHSERRNRLRLFARMGRETAEA